MFISFEGIDKSGKSTQIHLLNEFLIRKSYSVVLTQEPGKTETGKVIKKILLEKTEEKIDPLAELFLYLADRAQHVRKIIAPSLRERKIVISDRYADATVAYQGYGRGLPLRLINQLNAKATGGIWPTVTFLLDLPPEVALSRSKSNDRMEEESLDFHRKVREGYLEIARTYPQRVKIIQAQTPPARIHEAIKKIVADYLCQCSVK